MAERTRIHIRLYPSARSANWRVATKKSQPIFMGVGSQHSRILPITGLVNCVDRVSPPNLDVACGRAISKWLSRSDMSPDRHVRRNLTLFN